MSQTNTPSTLGTTGNTTLADERFNLVLGELENLRSNLTCNSEKADYKSLYLTGAVPQSEPKLTVKDAPSDCWLDTVRGLIEDCICINRTIESHLDKL